MPRKRAPKKPVKQDGILHPMMVDGREWDRSAVLEEIARAWTDPYQPLDHFITQHTVVGPDGKQWHMPSLESIYLWMRIHPEFREGIAVIREQRAAPLGEDIIAKFHDRGDDFVETERGLIPNTPRMAALNGLANFSKWWMSKTAPTMFGDKSKVELSGNVDIGTQIVDAIREREAGKLPSETTVIPDE